MFGSRLEQGTERRLRKCRIAPALPHRKARFPHGPDVWLFKQRFDLKPEEACLKMLILHQVWSVLLLREITLQILYALRIMSLFFFCNKSAFLKSSRSSPSNTYNYPDIYKLKKMSDSWVSWWWTNVWLIIDISPAVLNTIPVSCCMSRTTEFSFLKASGFIKLVQ